jgi:hypothetical protein
MTTPATKISSLGELEAVMRHSGYLAVTHCPRGPLFIAGDRQCSAPVVERAIESGRLRPQDDGLFGSELPATWVLATTEREASR